MSEIQRYSISPVLKTDERGNTYAAFEYVKHPSGMCLFFGDHASALRQRDERIAELEAENARLSAPVSDEEWERFCRHDEDGYELVNRTDAGALIAARKGAAS